MTPEPKKWLKDWYNQKYPEHGWIFHLNESTGINFEKVYLFMEQYAKDYIAAELEEAKARIAELEEKIRQLKEIINPSKNIWGADKKENEEFFKAITKNAGPRDV